MRPVEARPPSGSCHGRPSTTASSSASPVAGSASAETCACNRVSIHGEPASTYFGYAVSRSRSTNPSAADRAASSSTAGHGRSGLTWSAVTGETPPQSSMPALSISPNSSPTRFGGACTRIFGPSTSRVTAIVAARSSIEASGSSRIAVSGLARKFWTIISCTWPCARATPRIAKIDSARSTLFSPIPMRMPVVNGTPTRPASVSVRSRTAGSLSGLP